MAALSTGATPRREPRRTVSVNVRVFGLDSEGQPINCECSTIDISAHGARLLGTQHWRAGEIIGIRHGSEKGRFKIVWIGKPGTHADSQFGLQAVEISRHFWGVNMPSFPNQANTTAVPSRIAGLTEATPKPSRLGLASTSVTYADTRRHTRLRVNGGVKVMVNSNQHWGTVIDLSAGGCYLECPSTYPVGTVLFIKIGIEEFKFESDAVVRVSHPGMGMGVEFMRANAMARRALEDYVAELSRDPNRWR